MTCIFSTLLFVIDQSEKLRIQTPVITFDQPLWLKATEIVSAKSLHVVLVLGGFHLMMTQMLVELFTSSLTTFLSKIKRTDQVRILGKLRPGIKIDGKTTYIDPTLLFTRLTALLGPQDDVSEKFDFELTPEPTALFKYDIMRKATKSQLRNARIC